LAVRLCRARATYMPAEAGFGGCYVSIITLDIHKNNIKSNRDVLQNHDIYLAFDFGFSCAFALWQFESIGAFNACRNISFCAYFSQASSYHLTLAVSFGQVRKPSRSCVA
jgi:hypothetical protein